MDNKGNSLETSSTANDHSNQFVSYLNSLQRSGGGNENALAEFQSCNENFSKIYVEHPLSSIIYNELSDPEGSHVVLTGHAGDGKSTIALEVYKRLNGIPIENPLENPMNLREDKDYITIIKDLSERDKEKDKELINDLLRNKRSYLLVSNTGTLMDLIKNNSELFNKDKISLESDVLRAISTNTGEGRLILGQTKFRVFNLARLDNLDLALKIFKKMLSPKNWEACNNLTCQKYCPIKFNVELIWNNQKLILERIFLAYRRMFEYGTRLTIRQFTEHLAYLITSGIDESEIYLSHQSGKGLNLRAHLFSNRFFGDDGIAPDHNAYKMKAIQEISNQEFGQRPSSVWEHKLWLRESEDKITIGIKDLNDEFEKLRDIGSGVRQPVGMNPDRAREQVRRMLYFMYDFEEKDQNFLGKYLNSPTLLMWQSWKQPNLTLGLNEKKLLEQKIYHVIQEHFTGVRLPEGSTHQNQRLYVTLSRRKNEIRQSAQIVLAQVDWNDATDLEIQVHKNIMDESRSDLVLIGRNQIEGINLELRVPFLDYVMLRHYGELGEVIHASYIERLDCFKAKFEERARNPKGEKIMLVRLRTDHTFKRQYYAINDYQLEVTNA